MLTSDLENLPKTPGVYIFRDASNRVLYVGKAISLRARVSSYFQQTVQQGPKTQVLVSKIAKIDHVDVGSELEALLLEADLIKRLRPPYNISLKDDKNYAYIVVQKPLRNAPVTPVALEEDVDINLFPGVGTARRIDSENDEVLYFGPFPEGNVVRFVLRSLKKIFKFRELNRSSLVLRSRLGRAYLFGVGADPAGVKISPYEYNQNIRRLIKFLQSGQKDPIINDLKRQMVKLSQSNKFEEAAEIRDEIGRFEYVTQNFRPASEFLANPNLVADTREEALTDLFVILSKAKDPDLDPSRVVQDDVRIEGYDISHFGGKQMVGSMVVFINGRPSKSDYRRFRIKYVRKIDDVAALFEVLSRRLKNNWPLPKVLLVDGGKPQVAAARKVLKDAKLLGQIKLIGLSKRFEEIITADGSVIKLPKDSKALHLIQSIRDEAHRFANSYRKKLS